MVDHHAKSYKQDEEQYVCEQSAEHVVGSVVQTLNVIFAVVFHDFFLILLRLSSGMRQPIVGLSHDFPIGKAKCIKL